MAAPAEGFTFGSRIADDYKPAENDGVQWIRGFQAGSTQIRLAPCEAQNAQGRTVYGYKAWTSEREHYDKELQISYACTEEYGIPEPEGVGCKHPNKSVRDRSRKYYVNALNDDGELKIFKFGPVVWKAFKRRQDRMVADDPSNQQPLSDRDFIVHKSGSGMQGTEYEVENGEVYPVTEIVPKGWPELHDIPAAIKAAHEEAMAKYSGDEPLGADEEPPAARVRGRIGSGSAQVEEEEPRASRKAAEPEPDEEPAARPAAKKAAAATKKAAAAPAAKKAAAAPPADEADAADDPNAYLDDYTYEDIADLEIQDLRTWVKRAAAKVDPDFVVPERAPRSKLLKIAESIEAGDPPF